MAVIEFHSKLSRRGRYEKSEEHKQRLRDARLEKAGHPQSKETRQKISKAMVGNTHALGSTHGEEYKRAISERMMGNTLSLGQIGRAHV